MRSKGGISLGVLLLLVACGGDRTQDHVSTVDYPQVTTLQVVQGSTAVVQGTIGRSLGSRRSRSSTVYTDWTVDVAAWLKGTGPRQITVRERGGRMGGDVYRATDQAELKAGTSVVLCLTKEPGTDLDLNGEYYVSFGPSGFFAVTGDSLVPGAKHASSRKIRIDDFMKLVRQA